MIKIVFFCFITVVLALHLRDTVDDLKDYWKYVDTQVKGLQHQAKNEIRANLVPLSYYTTQAKNDLIKNITVTAKPYWDSIWSLEQAAEQKGQDISKCTVIGNSQVYELNHTIVDAAYAGIDYDYQAGENLISFSATEAYSVIEELLALGHVVDLCNDDSCATDLMKLATQFFERAKSTLIDATTKPKNYVLIYLPVLLTQYSLDSATYVTNYTSFLDDVTKCINNIYTLK